MLPDLRDLLFAEIDGWQVIPLGVAIGLAIIVVALAFSQLPLLLFDV